MRSRCCIVTLLTSLILSGCQPTQTQSTASGDFRSIDLSTLRDKIEGGWAGQMIGVSYGYPTEFWFNEKIIPEEKLPQWTTDSIANALDQDDLYVDMTFASVLDKKGLGATTEDFGAMFREAKYRLWHANLAARRALKRGVPASFTGTPQYNVHANDIDFQIESDFIGLMTPGLFQASNDLCYRVGRVMNYGDGIYGGMFVSGMYSAAFFEADPRKIVESGLACLPSKSPYAQAISDVLSWSRQHPTDWQQVWDLIEKKWNVPEACSEGARRPFNIDAKLNGAYIAVGLLYGNRDFDKTLEITTRLGQDSDCNPSNACGILGVMQGYQWIPDTWKGGIPAIADKKFNYTEFTFRTIVKSTEKRAIALVEQNGGRIEGDKLIVKLQQPKPGNLEVWDNYGSPVERIVFDDSRWAWKGKWITQKDKDRRGTPRDNRSTSEKGAEASILFEGSGAIVVGPYLPTGGRADVFLDGKLDRTVDVYSDEENKKFGEAIWHTFGLAPGKHTVRLVAKGEPYPGSKGSEIAITDLIVFR
jgi:ADP-ribosylglycohydrolase